MHAWKPRAKKPYENIQVDRDSGSKKADNVKPEIFIHSSNCFLFFYGDMSPPRDDEALSVNLEKNIFP